MQSTMRHLYLDDLSRNNDTKIAGRGVAMTGSTCAVVAESKGTAPITAGKGRTTTAANPLNPSTTRRAPILPMARSNDTADRKWCSVHKTTSHSDEECCKQGVPSPPQSGRAHIASVVLGASTRPAKVVEKPSLNFNGDFDEGFAFTGLLAGSGNIPTTTGSR